MKLNTRKSEDVELSPGLSSTSFQIKTSAKAFQALMGNLYSNKIGAIVREITSNAYDAHKEVGRENEPFLVQLPTKFNPQFVVEDYGPGLSDEMVRGQPKTMVDGEGNEHTIYQGGLYTTLFDSTKENTNDALGAYGLGSKTPFAYTKAFVIYSRRNGIENVYNAYLDAEGTPQIVLLGSSKTEKTGLRVEVPVNPEDNKKWMEEAKTYLPFFPAVRIEGDPDNKIAPMEYLWKEKNWAIADFMKSKSMDSCSVFTLPLSIVVGVVPYYIHRPLFNDVLQEMGGNFYDFFKNFRGIVFFANIGEVMVDVSRETIEHNDTTKEFLKTRFREMYQQITDEIKRETRKWNNWNAVKAAFQFNSYNIPLSSISGLVSNGDLYDKDNQTLQRLYRIEDIFPRDKYIITLYGSSGRRVATPENLYPESFELFFRDQPGTADAESMYAMSLARNHSKRVCVISRRNNRKKYKERNAKRMQKFLSDRLGGANIRLTSELPQNKKEKVPSKKTPQTLSYSPTHYKSYAWEPEEVNVENDSGVFVTLFKNDAYTQSGEKIENLLEIIRELKRFTNENNFRIIGARKSRVEDFRESNNWIALEDYVRRLMEEHKQSIIDSIIYDKIRGSFRNEAMNLTERAAKRYTEDPDVLELINIVKRKDQRGNIRYNRLQKLSGVNYEKIANEKIERIRQRLSVKYPYFEEIVFEGFISSPLGILDLEKRIEEYEL